MTELTLLLADGSVAVCSPTRDSDLFNATLCGIGATGVILRVKMTVEPAFRLKEIGETLPFDEFIGKMGELAKRAEHPRFWWFPAAGTVRCGYANRTTEVRFRSRMDTVISSSRVSPSAQTEAGSGIACWRTTPFRQYSSQGDT